MNAASNSSSDVPVNYNGADVATWSFSTVFSIAIQLSDVLANASILFLFMPDPSLLTPFTIYVANLFFANIISAIFCFPFELFQKLYSTWWVGKSFCIMAQYTDYRYVFSGGMRNAHVLIVLNRL
ncbi:hypothetical protein RvY_16835 [Ramazzottius varieornatus]|uniref:G-protein coupled receptors family 1 profile domain-containing protein n=1 Tax=Ramazzottius varieornatus TaxID=947166 RepID=A0A1D1VZY8_RAMVA|nr:hypothetical protein RvY_16835 [Ramazzottius varieornatus]